MNLFRTPRTHRHARMSTLSTITLKPTGFNTWQAMTKSHKMTQQGSSWRNEIPIHDECKDNKDEFLRLLSEFGDIWDGHLISIKTVGHGIELSANDIRLVHSIADHTAPTEGPFDANEIQKMLQMEVFEPSNTE